MTKERLAMVADTLKDPVIMNEYGRILDCTPRGGFRYGTLPFFKLIFIRKAFPFGLTKQLCPRHETCQNFYWQAACLYARDSAECWGSKVVCEWSENLDTRGGAATRNWEVQRSKLFWKQAWDTLDCLLWDLPVRCIASMMRMDSSFLNLKCALIMSLFQKGEWTPCVGWLCNV